MLIQAQSNDTSSSAQKHLLHRSKVFFTRALSINENNHLYQGLGEIENLLGNSEVAFDYWRRTDNYHFFPLRRGVKWHEQDELGNALSEYKTAIALEPTSSDAWFLLGLAYEQLGNGHFQDSLHAFKIALELDNFSGRSFHLKGAYFVDRIQPSSVYYHIGTLWQPREPKRAMIAYRTALEKSNFGSDLVEADCNYRVAYLLSISDNSKIDEQIAKCESALQLNPRHAAARTLLGQTLYNKSGSIELAESQIKEVIKNQPDFKSSYWMMGLIYEKEGLDDQALEMFKQVLKLDPNFEPAQQRIANVSEDQ